MKVVKKELSDCAFSHGSHPGYSAYTCPAREAAAGGKILTGRQAGLAKKEEVASFSGVFMFPFILNTVGALDSNLR